MNLTFWSWCLLVLGAWFSGLSKTGIVGVGVLSVALFANALPPRASTGALLPLLLFADVFGVAFFRKHASWPHLWRLLPWVVGGVVAGYWSMARIDGKEMQRLLGGILLVMIALQVWRKSRYSPLLSELPHARWLAALTGLLAGFTTMVANAAGPVMGLYLLVMGLPKLVFIGTGAWFFMLVNVFKVPFSAKLGLITADSLKLDAVLLVPLVPGALLGPVIVRRMDQTGFENMVLVFTFLASLRLLF